MWEFIIAVVVIWLVIKFTSVKKNVETNQEIGKEVKHIAIEELGVPEPDYYRLVMHHMPDLKRRALMMQNWPEYRGYSWSRVLAHAIYNRYMDIL
ncbi:hypothetical protein [Thiomicrospira microaerophila]|uniref:hypothetical protein n=1 Tax=Thiomicrospira microaerophila TaxID=406020 RepID=UPI0005C94096|nr:hypothetical protein [Thiomicrospira microaerophila]